MFFGVIREDNNNNNKNDNKAEVSSLTWAFLPVVRVTLSPVHAGLPEGGAGVARVGVGVG